MSKIFKKIGKAVKGVVHFVAKHWRSIALVAAVAFTAGVATVGFQGISTAFANAVAPIAEGGLGMNSFTAALKVAGSTIWAGATATAGSLGFGSGAQGYVAAQAGLQGATLGTGALAAKLGGKTAAINMAGAPTNSVAAGGSGLATSAGGQLAPSLSTPGVTRPDLLAKAKEISQVAPAPSAINPATGKVALDTGTGAVTPTVVKQPLLKSIASNPMFMYGALGAAQGYFQGKAAEQQIPLAAWGQNISGPEPSYVFPGQMNPATGMPYTVDEANQHNAQANGQQPVYGG